MPAKADNTLKVLWAIAFLLFLNSIYLWYLIQALPDAGMVSR